MSVKMLWLHLVLVIVNVFHPLLVAAYNFTEEVCERVYDNIFREFLSPTIFLEKITVYPDDLEYVLFQSSFPVLINDTTKYLIDPKVETKILLSGWLEDYNVKWVVDLRNVYLDKGPYNIIVLNWDEYKYMHYIFSTEICREVGRNLGDFIVSLVGDVGLDLNEVHVIGHSLGAHVAGFAGQQVMKRLRQRIGRISALDAAGPIFNFNTESYRLDKNDASFVDAVHTNDFAFGYKGPLGTVDVFVNNAVFQPGCPTFNDLAKSPMNCQDIHRFLFCSHSKSVQVWTESVNKPLIGRHIITGHPIVVGENINRGSRGFYYLRMSF